MRPSWMVMNDEIILEFLSEHDVVLPPKALAVNLNRVGVEISYSTVTHRLPELREHGFVEQYEDHDGYYQITEKGEQFLDRELDFDELENDD